MALINCPECDNQVSEKALACPKCGYPTASFSETEKRAQKISENNRETCPACDKSIGLSPFCPWCKVFIPAPEQGVCATPARRLSGFGLDLLIGGVVSLFLIIIFALSNIPSAGAQTNIPPPSGERPCSDIQRGQQTNKNLLRQRALAPQQEMGQPYSVCELEVLIALLIALAGAGALFWSKGTSPGKAALGMYVFKTDGQRAGFGTMLIRETIGKYLSGLMLSLGFLWILFDKSHQGWHDKLLSTVVLVKKSSPR